MDLASGNCGARCGYLPGTPYHHARHQATAVTETLCAPLQKKELQPSQAGQDPTNPQTSETKDMENIFSSVNRHLRMSTIDTDLVTL